MSEPSEWDYLSGEMQEDIIATRREIEALTKERDGARAQRDYLEAENKRLRAELTYMTAYADKLADGLPMLPKDIEVMREANGIFAQQVFDLEAELKAARAALAEVERLKQGLSEIYGISLDRDGYAEAESLGELVDELHQMAGNVLNGKPAIEYEARKIEP